MNNKYWVELKTDIYGNYFITDIEKQDKDKDGEQSLEEFIKEEINTVGYDDLFDYPNDFKFEPNKIYIAIWTIKIQRDPYTDEIEECIPSIIKITELKHEKMVNCLDCKFLIGDNCSYLPDNIWPEDFGCNRGKLKVDDTIQGS